MRNPAGEDDDDALAAYIGILENNKDLKSFRKPYDTSRDENTRRTITQLGKFRNMRESTAQLSDSFSSSMLLHRSSSSSSRQLSNVPAMVGGGTSFSPSSSPGGKPISPHTPHTPAVPSRLSANSIIDYSEPHRSRSRARNATSASRGVNDTNQEIQDDPSSETTVTRNTRAGTGTTAIDIPTSPRQWPYIRRASSVSEGPRDPLTDADAEDALYGIRTSASLPTDEPSLSELLTLNEPVDSAAAAAIPGPSRRPATVTNVAESAASSSGGVGAGGRRIPGSRGSGPGSADSDVGPSSSLDGGGGEARVARRGGGLRSPTTGRIRRFSFSGRGSVEEDEPLLFTMSELPEEGR